MFRTVLLNHAVSFPATVAADITVCRYGGLWKNLHKADKVPDHLQRPDIQAEELQALEATQHGSSS